MVNKLQSIERALYLNHDSLARCISVFIYLHLLVDLCYLVHQIYKSVLVNMWQR